jgi:hypothetical protein
MKHITPRGVPLFVFTPVDFKNALKQRHINLPKNMQRPPQNSRLQKVT